jgi:hypothetical protein
MNQIAIDDTVTDNDDKDEAVPLAEQLMKRGEFLRQLREMELADQAEREQTQEETEQPSQGKDDVIHVLSNGKKVLCYESFLKHQRYYDDLKHVDCHFIDFGISSCGGGRLVMEQDKCLGKGGLVRGLNDDIIYCIQCEDKILLPSVCLSHMISVGTRPLFLQTT